MFHFQRPFTNNTNEKSERLQKKEPCPDIFPDRIPFFMDDYRVEEREEKSFCLFVSGKAAQTAGKGTDMEAVLERYISIGKIRNEVLGSRSDG